MYVKKIKRICGVRGCKNKESYALSRSREMGNSVIICKDCLKEALSAIDKQYPEPKDEALTEEVKIDEFICPQCGKTFKSERGLRSHISGCQGAGEE